MLLRRCLAAALYAALVLTPASGSMAGPNPAQEAMKEGIAAEKKNDWDTARDAFQRAVDANDTPDARLHLARAEAKLGQLLEAASSYRMALEAKNAPPNVKAAAKKELATVTAQIPKLTIKTPEGFSGTVRIDKTTLTPSDLGKPIEQNPGSVVVSASADGFEPFKKTVTLAEGSSETVTIEMKAVPKKTAEQPIKVTTEDSSTRKTLAYVSLGVGGAGLVVGSIFGMMAKSTRNDLKDSCANDVCGESERDKYDKGKSQANIATIGFITAGVGLGVGTVLLLTAPKKKEVDEEKASITPYVGPMSLGVHGKF